MTQILMCLGEILTDVLSAVKIVNDEFLGRPNKIEKRSFRFYLPNGANFSHI